eukprot:CAMPEP_0116860850 /NCGR_PEP_ID=MMETSP0418-20121206/22662_1 /TAXON_ID=1158023 /ORGANISM="Astrosyne radiata, Strain 13vi08-1A" /LENGTH=464 /DNA_ID=CAMNT_0004495339 /DNA_START=84 /DNA_END=1476 /DNA_ORIENTATION=+
MEMSDRSPLKPIDPQAEVRDGPPNPPASTDSASFQSYFIESEQNEFELMHIRITLLALSGVLCQKKKHQSSFNVYKRHISNHLKRKSSRLSSSHSLPRTSSTTITPATLGIPRSNSATGAMGLAMSNSVSGSTMAIPRNISVTGSMATSSVGSSTDSPTIEDAASEDVDDGAPVTAVISYRRNISNSCISSHLPSHRLATPSSKDGCINRYTAQWPASDIPQHESLRQPEHTHSSLSQFNADLAAQLELQEQIRDIPQLQQAASSGGLLERSTFTLLRVMMKESYDRGIHGRGAMVPHYVHERIELQINLSKGSESIPLGVATLVVSGEEEGPITMNLPAKAIRFKGKKMVMIDDDNSNSRQMTRGRSAQRGRGKQGIAKGPARLFQQSSRQMAFPSDPDDVTLLTSLKISLQVFPQAVFRETEAAKARRKVEPEKGHISVKEKETPRNVHVQESSPAPEKESS